MKHESPPLRMKVLNGTLLPTSAWDQERIDSYRNGSIMNVHITQEKNRKLERKYWAILHRVVAQCPVRQRTAEDLHKAIRLKLGIVDAFWTIDGRLRVEIKSTSTMEDPEYSAFYEEAMALLEEITGVNPETLSAESADVGEDEDPETPVAPHAAGEGSDGDPQALPPAHVVAAEPAPAAADQAEEEAPDATGPEPAHGEQAASSSATLSPADKEFLIRVFKTMKAAVGPEINVFRSQALIFQDEIGGMSDLVKAKAKTIREHLQECCGEEPKKGTVAVAKYVAGIIGVDAKEFAD